VAAARSAGSAEARSQRQHKDHAGEVNNRIGTPENVGWLQNHQLYTGTGADIVMESISLIIPAHERSKSAALCKRVVSEVGEALTHHEEP
jgi:hypothetical protein